MAMSEERKAYQKEYYETNKEALLEKQRERNRKHYLANREKHKAKTQAWQAANPDRAKQLQIEYRERNKDKLAEKRKAIYEANKPAELLQRRHAKIRKYGITPDEFNEMLNAQGRVCAICGTDTPSKKCSTFRIDHCHQTGKVRGLLCMNCNSALGMFRDNIQSLQNAIAYLTKSSSGATSTQSSSPSRPLCESED